MVDNVFVHRFQGLLMDSLYTETGPKMYPIKNAVIY